MKIVNPATLATIAELPEDDAAQVASKVTRARAAQPAWAARPLPDRIAIIRKFEAALLANKDELALTLTR